MLARAVLATTALLYVGAFIVWARSARMRQRVARHVLSKGYGAQAQELSHAIFVKDVITAAAFGAASIAAGVAAAIGGWVAWPVALLVPPAVASVVVSRRFTAQARLSQDRWDLERRAEETLSQDELAPKRWAERLAPQTLPSITGFELGQVYQAGTGMMAGDFYDVIDLAPTRVAAVIGDVSGHDIDASITAFQAKYLLRVFLQQYRDPAQAVEQLNATMSRIGLEDEFISLCVVVFDLEAATLRYASAGHPPAWLWHDRELRPLRATGPVLMLQTNASYHSREVDLDIGDVVVLYTDGLAEARAGAELFGEERIAAAIRRDPNVAADVLCKDLIEQARRFATRPIADDVAILAVRRV